MMKRTLLLILLLFISLTVFSSIKNDTAGVVTITKLPNAGLLLDKGWKFCSGDDPAFAKTDFNDHSWQSIDPTMLIPDLPKNAQTGIGWLRIKLRFAGAKSPDIFINVHQSTALEIYANGRLFAKRGTINRRLKTGRGYLDIDPISLPPTSGNEVVIAVRFAHQPVLKRVNVYIELPIFYCYVNDQSQLKNAVDNNKYYQFTEIIGISIFTLLAILHSILFRYNSKNRSNLYFAFFSICASVYGMLQFTNSSSQYCDTAILIDMCANALLSVAYLFLVKALFTLFKFQSKGYFPVLVIIAAFGVFSWVFIEYFKLYSILLATLLLTATEAWLILKAVINKKRGAPIILVGFIIAVIGSAYYMIETNFQSISGSPDVISTCMSSFGIPLSISIYLGREFALDRQLLEIKLEEVQTLSKLAITNELEKQAILTSQNEQLEINVAQRTADLNQSLINLKATQTQLIQTEKMASLGELTAGIAHEIQNPLNFVNNFSEVNTELIDELQEEVEKGNYDEVKALAGDIKDNQQKISQHGKRADFIVKGMLLHSRNNSGERQSTNINVLADEFFKLSYHGLRAKDKNFNAEMVTNFDKGLPAITVVQQDIGRVLLNLFNNAFYATNQKAKTAGVDYKPEVTVSTSFEEGNVVIKVKDNGAGIPDAIKEKIMQPFFTTKPTGEGTGLGLSLTYDMVVKGHGGSIKVESKEGEGSEFMITLPIG